MKVLIVGSGGREHALALEITKSPLCSELLCAPGNPGMEAIARCIAVGAENVPALVALAQSEKVDFVVVGPEVALVLGIVDELTKVGIKAFGPSAEAAQLEGSKAFSKNIMAKYRVPTAAYQNFTDLNSAQSYLRKKGAPIVIKASGLAAGKGAIVCPDMQTAEQALEDMLGEKAVFGDAGAEVVIEEFMIGEEASIFAICDGENYVLLSPAQDHKQVNDGDKGLNTGGMGAYAPAPVVTPEVLKEVETKIIKPTLEGMIQEKAPYKGVLYVGIMVTEQGSKVVEYNCRFGDPECQILLPLYSGDVLELLYQAATGNLSELKVASNEGSAAIVVLASEGYPGSYPKGRIISGIDTKLDGVHIIHAGTKKEGSSIVTSGGRVLGVVGQGDSLQVALDKAYNVVNKVSFDGAHYRTDIGKKGLDKFLT